MPGNTASLTFKLFGIDVNASRTISGVGVAAAGTAKDLQVLSTNTLKFVGIAGAAGVASVGLAGALGVGLGAAFAGVGVAAALMNKNVKKEFKTLGQGIKDQISAAAKPVQDSMLQLFKYISSSIKTMGPLFHTFFAAVAPLVTIIGHGLVQAVASLIGEFTPLIRTVLPIVRSTFAVLPDLIGGLAAGLQAILQPLSANTAAWTQFLGFISELLPAVGGIIGLLVRLGQQIMPVFTRSLGAVVAALQGGLAQVLPLVGKAIQQMLPPIQHLIQSLFPALVAILRALLPVLSGVVAALAGALAKVLPQLVPAFVGLIQVVGQLVKGIQPLLPSLVFLAVWVSKVANNLLSAILPVVTALLGGLLPALKMILPIIISVAVTVGNALADAFKKTQPSLVLLARAVGQILVALTPLIPVVVAAALSFLPIIPATAKIASVLAQGLVPIVLALTPLLVFLAPTLVKIAVGAKLWAIAQGILNVVLLANPIGLVIIAVAALAAGIIYAYKHSETFRRVVDTVFNAIKGAVGTAVNFIIGLLRSWLDVQFNVVAGILRVMGKLPGPMGAPFRKAEEAVRGAKKTVDDQLDKIQARVNKLTGKDIPITARTNVEVAKSVRQYLAASNVPGFHAKGALLPGYGGGDIVPAMLEPGEAVVPKHLVPEIAAWAKARRIPGFQMGGLVTRFYDPTIRQTGRIGQSMADVAAAVLGQLGGIGGPSDVRSVAIRTLALLGRPLAELGAWIRRIMFESGGNASIVNRSDSNWFAGHPSVGLAQVIRGTFAAWAGPFRNTGPFLYGVSINPLANSFAGANYAVHRYGSLAAVDPQVRHAGYATGTPFVPWTGWAMLHRGEAVIPAGANRGGTVINVTVNGAVGSKVEVIRWVREGVRQAMRREGRNPGGI